MATATKPETTTKPAKEKKPAISVAERVKAQLTTAALKAKINGDELAALAAHIDKLKALLA